MNMDNFKITQSAVEHPDEYLENYIKKNYKAKK
jgi:hypothetical protein